jgi:hypothetical protein
MNERISIDDTWLAKVVAKVNEELSEVGQVLAESELDGVYRDQCQFQRDDPLARATKLSLKAQALLQWLP